MTNMSKPTRYDLRVTDEGAGLYATDAPNKNGMQYVMASAYDALEARMAAQPPIGWRVIHFSGSWKRRDERWEVYSPEGSGGAVEASEILNADVAALLDSMASAHPLQAERESAIQQILDLILDECRYWHGRDEARRGGFAILYDAAREVADKAKLTAQLAQGATGKEVFIVWNERAEEGVVFTDRSDAHYAATGRPMPGTFGVSTIGDAFRETFADDAPELQFPMIRATLPVTGAHHDL